MSKIIAGRFDATVEADAALEALRREGFQGEELDSFYVAPPGQHDLQPGGGDSFASEGTGRAGIGAIVGAVIGAVIGALLASLFADNYRIAAILVGAALFAYVGSFLGAMRKVRGGEPAKASVEHPLEPRGGRMIAVKADRPGSDARAAQVLREHGARDVGRAEGDWRNGWKDFDPRAPLMQV